MMIIILTYYTINLNMEFLTYLLYLILTYYTVALTIFVIPTFLSSRSSSANSALKTTKLLIVFGSGGHTTEMLLMLRSIDFKSYGRVHFVIGHSDTWSLTKIKDYFQKNRNINIEEVANLTITKLFRSREVKQSYFTSVFTTLMGLVHSLLLVLQIRPDIVTCLLNTNSMI